MSLGDTVRCPFCGMWNPSNPHQCFGQFHFTPYSPLPPDSTHAAPVPTLTAEDVRRIVREELERLIPPIPPSPSNTQRQGGEHG